MVINPYLKNLCRIEFVITHDCTGRCIHCSEGGPGHTGKCIDEKFATNAVFALAKEYRINSVMTFGGEPLLYPECVFGIHSAAREMKIPKRQLITNGFFSKDIEKIKIVSQKLAECGVNDILLSVDAFHQETIPLEVVKLFAEETKKNHLPIRTSPAWLVSKADTNPYNMRTAEIVEELKAMGIEEGNGNVVFPRGNALKYLKSYFSEDKDYACPYDEDPRDVRAISIEPCGTVMGREIQGGNIIEILNEYTPPRNEA